MPAATATKDQKEIVRLLYLQHGPQEASKLSGVRYDLVRKWASLGNWQAFHKPSLVALVADRVQDELADNERETKLSLSRYAKRAARDSESASLRDAPYVKAVAQVAGLTHRWNDDKAPSHFTLNMLNINSLEIDGDTPEQQA